MADAAAPLKVVEKVGTLIVTVRICGRVCCCCYNMAARICTGRICGIITEKYLAVWNTAFNDRPAIGHNVARLIQMFGNVRMTVG